MTNNKKLEKKPHRSFSLRKVWTPFCALFVLSFLRPSNDTLLAFYSNSSIQGSSNTGIAGVKVREELYDSSCCGVSWTEFRERRCLRRTHFPAEHPIVWTVSGGEEYRLLLPTLLNNWEQRIMKNNSTSMLVIALDAATADTVCAHQFMAVHWDTPAQSYSRVADAKFQVAASWSSDGHHQLFAELDVFCRGHPLPVLLRHAEDLVLMGHGDLQQKVNIGMYYVRPTAANTALFTTTSKLLAPSLNASKRYLGNENELQEYFDQDVFHNCLGISHDRFAVMRDPTTGKDALDACREIMVPFKVVSNLYFSSYRPPIVHDTTVCVHPLDIRPFTSIRTKVATAKFYGFDPAVYDNTTQYIKTASGDLTFSEDWNTGFFMNEFTDRSMVLHHLQRPIAIMVALAQRSNRTLVLPRNIRDKAGRAYPVYSLVSTASIEKMGVSWRFGPVGGVPAEPGTIVEFASFRLSVSSALGNLTAECAGRTVCSIHGLYRNVLYPLDDGDGVLDSIIRRLTWCLSPPDYGDEFLFTHGLGAHEWACP